MQLDWGELFAIEIHCSSRHLSVSDGILFNVDYRAEGQWIKWLMFELIVRRMQGGYVYSLPRNTFAFKDIFIY